MQEDNDSIEKEQPFPEMVTGETVQSEPVDPPQVEQVEVPAVTPQTPVAVEQLPAPEVEPAKAKSLNNPGIIVLQWLVYAFWGWTVLAVCIMTWAIISYYMDGLNIRDGALYGVAALLVLLPLSLGCDIFYRKKEPEAKTGAASIIMIIHSVIFALFGIGALISAVLSGVNLLIGTSTVGVLNTLLTSLIIFVIYFLVFLRTILPKKVAIVRTVFLVIMATSIVVICIASFVGPIASKKLLQYDENLNTGLNEVSDGIESYVGDNYKLPEKLSDLYIADDTAANVVSQGLISYTQKGESLVDGINTFYYQLCVVYKANSNNYSSPYNTIRTVQPRTTTKMNYGEYDSYLSTYNHPSGDYCYKLKVVDYVNERFNLY